MQKQPPEVFYLKKAFLKNFALFTRKHLCWSLFLIQNIAKFLRAPILKNICERLLLKMCYETENLKIVHKFPLEFVSTSQSIETHGWERLLQFSLFNRYVENKVTWI